MAQDYGLAAQRPRWAMRELISWLAAGLLLVGIFALVNAGFQVVDQVVGPGGVVQVMAPFGDAHVGNGGLPLPPGTLVDQNGSAETRFHVSDLPVGLRLLIGSGQALSGLATFVGALLGRRILLSIGEGRPFDRRNPRRFVGLAMALLVGGVGASAISTAAAHAVLGYLGRDTTVPLFGPVLPIQLDTLWWAPLALAVAEAFRRGRQLAEDADGLV